jgi:hypothetical protein
MKSFYSFFFENVNAGKTVVIFPGGFHPFHKGHKSVYDNIVKTFPNADKYIAISDYTAERPFTAQEKKFIISSTGIDPKVVQVVKSPFRSEEIMRKYDPNKDVVIFAMSEKEKSDPQKASFFTRVKKDGSPSYFQDYESGKQLEPFGKHGYIYVFPSIDFNILGKSFKSASELRKYYQSLDDQNKINLLKELYTSNYEAIKKIFDERLT